MLLKNDFPFNCKHCGQTISGPVKYCPFCGELQEIIAAPPVLPAEPPQPKRPQRPQPSEEVSEPKVTPSIPEVVSSRPELIPQNQELNSSELEINLPEYETAEAHKHEDDSWKNKEGQKPVPPPLSPFVRNAGIAVAMIIGLLFVKSLFTDKQPTPLDPVPVPPSAVEPAPSAPPAEVAPPAPVKEQPAVFVTSPPYSPPSIEIKPDNSTELQRQQKIDNAISEGISSYKRKRYEQSKAHMRDALTLDPGNQVAQSYIDQSNDALRRINEYVRTGIAYYNKGQLELTIEKMNEALRLDPGNNTARQYLAMAENRQRERDREFEHPVTGEVR